MRIVVAPLHEVEAAIERWAPSHVISLASPGAETAAPPTSALWLPLTFHDIAEPRAGLIAAAEADVRGLLEFAADWAGTAGAAPLLIQCWAGVSRSPAAAFVVACALAAPGTERDVADRLRAAAPFATPNPRLVALADALLARDGRMAAAVAAIGRGAETAMGRTFAIAADGLP